MRITNHIVEDIEYVEAGSHGGIIIPKFLVIHFTAMHNTQDVVDLFVDNDRKVSAHFVLGPDGRLVQQLPCNIKGHHAGTSYWKGHAGLNSHSIGIEVVNYGSTRLFDDARGLVLDRRGRQLPGDMGDPDNWIYGKHHLHGGPDQYWQKFTDEQFAVLDILVPTLVYEYNLREVVGHDEIATPPGRKPDPGPAFPLEHYKDYAEYANAESEGRYIVVGTNELNVRGGPGTQYTIINKFKKGDAFKVLKFQGDWALIDFDSKRGWVHEAFIMRA